MIFGKSRTSENRDARSDEVKTSESADELTKNPQCEAQFAATGVRSGKKSCVGHSTLGCASDLPSAIFVKASNLRPSQRRFLPISQMDLQRLVRKHSIPANFSAAKRVHI